MVMRESMDSRVCIHPTVNAKLPNTIFSSGKLNILRIILLQMGVLYACKHGSKKFRIKTNALLHLKLITGQSCQ